MELGHVTLGGEGGGKPRTPPPFLSLSTGASLKLRYQKETEGYVFNVTMYNVSIAHVHIDPKSA